MLPMRSRSDDVSDVISIARNFYTEWLFVKSQSRNKGSEYGLGAWKMQGLHPTPEANRRGIAHRQALVVGHRRLMI